MIEEVKTKHPSPDQDVTVRDDEVVLSFAVPRYGLVELRTLALLVEVFKQAEAQHTPQERTRMWRYITDRFRDDWTQGSFDA